jgi:hypothetical protein
MFERLGIWGAILLISAAAAHSAVADDTTTIQQVGFRVETDVFFGDQKAPEQQTKTLFSGGVAYDISFNDPNQITMIDPQRDRIILMDKARKIQTRIDLKQLHEFIDAARKQAQASQLGAYIDSDDKVEVADDGIGVGDGVLHYHATLQQPRDGQMAMQYAKVADALAMLNGWRSGVPPFARLRLNQAVAEQKSLPEEITRTSGTEKQANIVRCWLHTNWRLSRDDEEQIAEIGKLLVTLETVSVSDFYSSAP